MDAAKRRKKFERLGWIRPKVDLPKAVNPWFACSIEQVRTLTEEQAGEDGFGPEIGMVDVLAAARAALYRVPSRIPSDGDLETVKRDHGGPPFAFDVLNAIVAVALEGGDSEHSLRARLEAAIDTVEANPLPGGADGSSGRDTLNDPEFVDPSARQSDHAGLEVVAPGLPDAEIPEAEIPGRGGAEDDAGDDEAIVILAGLAEIQPEDEAVLRASVVAEIEETIGEIGARRLAPARIDRVATSVSHAAPPDGRDDGADDPFAVGPAALVAARMDMSPGAVDVSTADPEATPVAHATVAGRSAGDEPRAQNLPPSHDGAAGESRRALNCDVDVEDDGDVGGNVDAANDDRSRPQRLAGLGMGEAEADEDGAGLVADGQTAAQGRKGRFGRIVRALPRGRPLRIVSLVGAALAASVAVAVWLTSNSAERVLPGRTGVAVTGLSVERSASVAPGSVRSRSDAPGSGQPAVNGNPAGQPSGAVTVTAPELSGTEQANAKEAGKLRILIARLKGEFDATVAEALEERDGYLTRLNETEGALREVLSQLSETTERLEDTQDQVTALVAERDAVLADNATLERRNTDLQAAVAATVAGGGRGNASARRSTLPVGEDTASSTRSGGSSSRDWDFPVQLYTGTCGRARVDQDEPVEAVLAELSADYVDVAHLNPEIFAQYDRQNGEYIGDTTRLYTFDDRFASAGEIFVPLMRGITSLRIRPLDSDQAATAASRSPACRADRRTSQ